MHPNGRAFAAIRVFGQSLDRCLSHGMLDRSANLPEHVGIVREFSAKQLDLPAFPFPGEIVLLDPETIRSDRPVFQCETRLRNERLEQVKENRPDSPVHFCATNTTNQHELE